MYESGRFPTVTRRLDARCVVVTGAASGIGEACARQAAQEGALVVLADLDMQGLREVAAAIVEYGGVASVVKTDVTRSEQCVVLTDIAEQRYGSLGGIVIAAGFARHIPLLEMSRTDWEEMHAVHLTGAFLCLQAAAKVMVRNGGGSAVYVGSSAAAGLGPLHQAHYVAAKAGALGLVRAAARELAEYGIRVNAVSPGFTNTSLNSGLFSAEEIRTRAEGSPLGRVAEVDDVANVVSFLLSDASSFMTGQTLHVNGGTHMP